MRRSAILLLALPILFFAGCVSGPFGPTPGQVALRRSDVPHGMTKCGYSGAVSGYLHWLKTHHPPDYEETLVSWSAARSRGARSSEVVGYATAGSGCQAPIGQASGDSAASWVIQSNSAKAAARVYRQGLLGFATPGGQTEDAQLIVGVATGLGSNSWVLQLATPAPGIYVAWWQDQEFDVLLLATGVQGATGHQMALFMDQRIQ